MNYKWTLGILVLFLTLSIGAIAQDSAQIASDFEKGLPQMSSSNIQEMETAQQSWQKVCMQSGAPGNESLKKEVNRLMIEQLEKDIPVVTKVWLLHQLTWTGGEAEVGPIAKLLDHAEIRIRDGAARALAGIPAPSAAQALKDAEKQAKEAELKRLQDALEARSATPAQFPPESEMPLALPYAKEEKVADWMKGYDKMGDFDKAKTLAAIAVRRDQTYFPLIVDAQKSSDPYLKKVAILALEKMGTVKELPFLVEDAVAFDRGLAIRVLSNMTGPGIDEALLKAINAETEQEKFLVLAEVLARRNNRGAMNAMVNMLKRKEFGNRIGLCTYAEMIAVKDDTGAFVDAYLAIEDRSQRDSAEQIVSRLCEGDAKPVIAKITDSNKLELIPLLGRVGGSDALAYVKQEFNSKTAGMHDAAVRAYANWPNAVVAEELLQIAEDAKEADANRIAALRAFIRVISLPDDKIGISLSGQDKLAMMKKAMSIATRSAERGLILERLSAIREKESVEYALEFVDDPDVSASAYRAIVEIAHHDYMRRGHKELFEKALDQVIKNCKTRTLVERAKKYRDNM